MRRGTSALGVAGYTVRVHELLTRTHRHGPVRTGNKLKFGR
jgi:hypothetical protein